MFVGIGYVCIPIAIITYKRINAQRDAAARVHGEKGGCTDKELRELGDRAPDFRYML